MGPATEGRTRSWSRRLFGRSLCLTLFALLGVAPAAPADFHIVKIREVYPGGAAGSSYVVLQMYAAGQNNLAPLHHIDLYGPTGNLVTTFTFANDPPNGSNQATVLVADTGYGAAFPGGPTPDAEHAALDISAAGGAVCFDAPDCVSWGNFTGSQPSAGSPASPSGVTASMALHRTIAGGSCTNQLDGGDDTNQSLADFIEKSPHPRSNSSPIEEGVSCTPPIAPNTEITGSTPPARTNSTEATFAFAANPPDEATFECRLDSEISFTTCSSPKSYSGLAGGSGTSHTFRVRAVHPTNGTDPTPATHTWTVDTVAPTVTIVTKPKDPSPGDSASFAFTPSESVGKFECSLDEGAVTGTFSECSSPKNYTNLLDGTYTFNVQATDLAGNPGLPTSYPWVVDNSLKDETPPVTTITSAPPDPSTSAAASFAYESNEPGSSFECALDLEAFAPCPAAGASYSGLPNGAHTFRVRAIDPSGNKDESPAGYSWQVVVFQMPEVPPLLSLPSPQTTITHKPRAVTVDRTPTVRFRSSIAGSTFECRLDRAAFRSCASPLTLKPLARGAHVLLVRAVAAGVRDPTPARAGFFVKRDRRR